MLTQRGVNLFIHTRSKSENLSEKPSARTNPLKVGGEPAGRSAELFVCEIYSASGGHRKVLAPWWGGAGGALTPKNRFTSGSKILLFPQIFLDIYCKVHAKGENNRRGSPIKKKTIGSHVSRGDHVELSGEQVRVRDGAIESVNMSFGALSSTQWNSRNSLSAFQADFATFGPILGHFGERATRFLGVGFVAVLARASATLLETIPLLVFCADPKSAAAAG